MTLVDQWKAIESGLDPSWHDARLALTIADPDRLNRAAALLGPANPGRAGRSIRFLCGRRGAGVGPEAVRRMLRRIDEEKIAGTLELVSSDVAVPEPAISRPTLAAAWVAGQDLLPSDWSDIYCELELTSTDDLDRAALLCAPLNPTLFGGTPAYRFRCARSFGYGASSGMVQRCLERLDAEGVRGEVRVLRVLCDTHPNLTQGPVWHVGGRTV